MKANIKIKHFVFYLFCALSFFSFGTAMMDYFLVYPSRYLVSEADFIAYHNLLESAILPVSVLPFLLIIILNIILMWVRPGWVSKKLLTISLVLLLLDFASTALLQAPWNFQLGKGKNIEIMDKITSTNWIRVFLESAQAIVVFMAMIAGNKE
jgi:hypothetical protein